jgi:hypothetical protein
VIRVDPQSYLATDSPLPRKWDDATRLEVEEAVLANGVESLAFYKSIHLVNGPPYSGKWGIFIFDYALPYMAPEIKPSDDGLSPEDCRSQAFNFLYYHERFHFLFDAWVISHEAVTERALYVPYQDHVYWAVHPGELCVEESLANHYAFEKSRRSGIGSFLRRFLEEQPDAYANFRLPSQDEIRARLAAQVFDNTKAVQSITPSERYEHVAYLGQERGILVNDSQCPVYIVLNADPALFKVPAFALPDLNEIRLYLKNYLGGNPVKGRSKGATYELFMLDNGEKVRVPKRGPQSKIKQKELRHIRDAAGMNSSEFTTERDRTHGWETPRPEPKPPLRKSKKRR